MAGSHTNTPTHTHTPTPKHIHIHTYIGLLRLYAIQNQTILSTAHVGPRISISDTFASEANLFFHYAVKAYSSNPSIIADDILLNNLNDTSPTPTKVRMRMRMRMWM
jgi:hypothetical protein